VTSPGQDLSTGPITTGNSRTARFAWAAVAIILVGVIVLVTYALTRPTNSPVVAAPATAPAAVVTQLATVPTSAFDDVGVSSPTYGLTPPTVLRGQPALTEAGKPEVLWVGSEFCPFCAAERWPLIVALSRFGRFTALYDAQSSPSSVFPDIQSFSFAGATYSSRYLAFTGVELYSDQLTDKGTYTRMARLTPGQAALLARYGAPRPGGATPFVDIANEMTASTSGFSPAALVHLSQATIAGDLDRAGTPNGAPDPTGQAVLAAANQLTVGLCTATDQRPASVCTSRAVREAASALEPA
jgi:hypothetical protein